MWRRAFFSLLILAAVFCPPHLSAQDAVTVGTVQADGATVSVPIYVRDASGTPLGRDKAPGSRIQSLSIRVNFDSSLVASASIDVDGITAGLNDTFKVQPSDAVSASLLVTFEESSNLVPFTLDAPGPGDHVATLTLTLRQPVPAGATIPLQLDPSLTQLTDAGGSAASKESAANGTLELIDGAVKTPALSLAFTPDFVNVEPGASVNVTAMLNGATASPLTINLTSTDSGVVTPSASSITIAAGATSAVFAVNGVAPGRADVIGSGGGLTAAVAVNVAAAPVPCFTPVAPTIQAPSSVYAGASYTISWTAIEGATSYTVEESTNAAFTNPLVVAVTATSATFTHGTIPPDRYYYRVRARSVVDSCSTFSVPSNVVQVMLSAAPVESLRIIPVAGSTPGALGSYFRTLVQLHNDGTDTVSGRFVFHPAGTPGSSSDPVLAFSIAPGKTVSYADLLPAMGVASGLGSVDFIANAGSAFPVAAVRVFNDGGAAGTSGFTMDPVRPEEYLSAGGKATLFAPVDPARFRLNVGVRTLEQGANVTIQVRDSEGQVKTSVLKSFGANFFTQVAAVTLLDGYVPAGGDTIRFEVTSGSAVIYGATTDNVTNDASVQLANP